MTSILAGDGLKPPASRSHDIKYIFFLVDGTCNVFETSDEIYTIYIYIHNYMHYPFSGYMITKSQGT